MLVISNSVISRNILCIIEYIMHNLTVTVNMAYQGVWEYQLSHNCAIFEATEAV